MAGTDIDLASFGVLLKALRTRRRLTQQQLAQAIGLHRSAVVRWEQGDFLPSSKTLVLELARHLHLDAQETRHLLEASLTALAPHWSVPLPRNLFFTGREGLLERLHTLLHADHMVALSQSAALHGLGGIGKTQIALEYAYRHALEYSAVFWIAAETNEGIVSSLVQMAEALQLPGRADQNQQRVVVAVQHWLATHRHWLLIWDNVEDLTLLDRLLPPARQGAILLTTRAHALGTLAQGIDLVPMDQEEGILFLLRRTKLLAPDGTSEQVRQFAARMPADYAAVAELVRIMGGLPLALDQTGAYLEATRCSPPAYLDLFRTQRAALLQERGDGAREHPASVFSTFTLALAATTRRHPAVGDLLRVGALLHAEAIPEELFLQGAAWLGAALETVCRDPLEWNRVVASACAYSLVSRNPEEQTLSLHRLVQAILVDTMTEAEREQWSRQVIAALNAAFPEVTHEVWGQCERLLPHVLACASAIPESAGGRVVAKLLQKAASYLHNRGQYAQAETLYQRALRIQEQIPEVEHPDLVDSLTGLAFLYTEQGNYAQAEPLYQQALHIQERMLRPEDPALASTLHKLAALYGEQGRDQQAEAFFKQALAILEQAPEPSRHKMANSLNGLASLYLKQEKYEQAEPLYQRALSIWEQAFGLEHPLLTYALNGLATLWSIQEKYEQAEPLYQRALSISEQVYGETHPNVAYILVNRAEFYTSQGKYQQAESWYQRALPIWEQALGREHPNVAYILAHQAECYTQQGKYEQAEPLYRRALAIRERHLGQDHPETAQTFHELALLRQQQGQLHEARSLAERALSIRAQALGETHPKTIATRVLYAQLLQEPTRQEEEPGADRPVEPRPHSPRAKTQTAGSVRRGALPPASGAPTEPSQAVPANASLPGSIPPGAAEDASGSQTGSGTRSPLPDRRPLHTMRVAVRGADAQVAYTRTVRMREVAFTCTICGQTVTQLHYPSGRIKYCSEACRAISAAQRHQVRVAKQRERRRTARGAQLQAQQGRGV